MKTPTTKTQQGNIVDFKIINRGNSRQLSLQTYKNIGNSFNKSLKTFDIKKINMIIPGQHMGQESKK